LGYVILVHYVIDTDKRNKKGEGRGSIKMQERGGVTPSKHLCWHLSCSITTQIALNLHDCAKFFVEQFQNGMLSLARPIDRHDPRQQDWVQLILQFGKHEIAFEQHSESQSMVINSCMFGTELLAYLSIAALTKAA